MIVVDASVILHALTEGPLDKDFIDQLQDQGELIAPELIYVEVISGLRKLLRLKLIDSDLADIAIGKLQSYPITLQVIHTELTQIWALRNNFSSYDAAYVVLAAEHGVPLLTRDKKLAQAVVSHTQVILI